jgi:hypothetical protein
MMRGNLGFDWGSYFSGVMQSEGSDFLTSPELQQAQPNDPYALGSTAQAAGGAAASAVGELLPGLPSFSTILLFIGAGIILLSITDSD